MKEKSTKVLEKILDLMCVDSYEIELSEIEDGTIRLNINELTDRDTALLIGRQGDNLYSLQYIWRTLVREIYELENREEKMLALDVMNYKMRQIDSLTLLAKKMSQEVKDNGREIVLRPMNAFERRIVHMTLRGDDFVETESVGEEPERKIKIKFIGSKQIEI
jgi:spoIIIJ-associated protein